MKFSKHYFPLALSFWVVGCQSPKMAGTQRPFQNGSARTSLLDNNNPNDFDLNELNSQLSSKNPSATSLSRNSNPQFYSIVKFKNTDDDALENTSDELETSESLLAVDEALLAENPDEFSIDDSLAAKNNPLLCREGTFYGDWVKQFDSQWLAKNSKKYKKHIQRTKALAVARTNEFIRLVYPSIEKTGYDFPVEMNSQVLSWIGYFTGAGRKNFVVWLQKGQTLIPEMQKTLALNGLPSDLVYLSMIESGYSSKALSNVGAVGLWQFMPATGREYGLKINDWLDERRHVAKSTQAAAGYLKDLYTRFGSWHLAAAGYNGGPGLVSKKLRIYGEDTSFFELSSKRRINSQTANYVPKILAAMIVAKNASLFGFDSAQNTAANQTKEISITRSISLVDLANSIGVDQKVLFELNPELRLGITPPANKLEGGVYQLIVPSSKAETALASVSSLPDAPKNQLIAARIKRFEKVSTFAKRYKLSLASVLKSNSNLKANSSLHKGQVVFISVILGTGQYDNLTKVKYTRHGKHHHKKLAHKNSHKNGHSAVKAKKSKSPRLAYSETRP